MTLGMLILPHTNARYFRSVRDLSVAEMAVMSEVSCISDIEYRVIDGFELLCFQVPEERLTDALKVLKRHSSCQAVFAIQGDLLRPLLLPGETPFQSDIGAILKYKGKTNERFTSLLINTAVFSGAFARQYDENLSILDPMCGRATTLLEGLRVGYNAAGIEVDKSDVKMANQFLKEYLQFHKVKHTVRKDSMTAKGKAAGERTRYAIGNGQEWTLILGDTADADAFFKPESFHALVVDLPYGIQHAFSTGKKRAQIDALMRAVLPRWRNLLKPGAAAAVSFNAHSVSRDALRGMLAEAGFRPLKDGPYEQYRHWVEQAIDRDIAVAVRD